MPSTPTITTFFEHILGAPLRNSRWSWGAINPNTGHLFLRVWEDQQVVLDGRDCVLLMQPIGDGTGVNDRHKPGVNERRKHIEAFQKGAQTYAVLCTAIDTHTAGRSIKEFDSSMLAHLDKIVEVGESTYAVVSEYFAIDDIVRSTKGSAGTRWTRTEMQACVDAYLEMLAAEQHEDAYAKSAYNERLRQGPLSERTKASVEYRMRNISAVLEDLGLRRIKGYLPAQNVGSGSRSEIMTLLGLRGHIHKTDYEDTADEEELQRRATSLRAKGFESPPIGNRQPATTTNSGVAHLRSPAVRAWVLQAAEGVCELCRDSGPFIGSNGEPFLEVHHVVPLADEGPDTIDNAISLCPNCHRRCHYAKDCLQVRDVLYMQVHRLKR